MSKPAVASSSLLATTAAMPLNDISPVEAGANVNTTKFREWELCCADKGGRKIWMVRFERSQPKFLFAKLVIELNWTAENQMLGVLVLPRGLRISEGVRIQLDDGPFSKRLAYMTNGPAGGIVKLDFQSEALEQLRNANRFNILTQSAASSQKLLFCVPLDGFTDASDRLKEINRGQLV